MKGNPLNYSFHNPNTVEDTANFLVKLFVEVNKGKVDEAIRQAAIESPELNAYLPGDKPPAATEVHTN